MVSRSQNHTTFTPSAGELDVVTFHVSEGQPILPSIEYQNVTRLGSDQIARQPLYTQGPVVSFNGIVALPWSMTENNVEEELEKIRNLEQGTPIRWTFNDGITIVPNIIISNVTTSYRYVKAIININNEPTYCDILISASFDMQCDAGVDA